MTERRRQINLWTVALDCIVVALVASSTAWGQDGGEDGGASAESAPASAPTQSSPSETVGEVGETDEAAHTMEASGGREPLGEESAPVTPGTSEVEESAPGTSEVEESAPGTSEAEGDEGTPRHRQFGHRYQGGVGFVVGTGYFFEVAYGGSYCYMEGEAEPSVCHGRSPVFFDFQASFGVTDGLEILLEYRLGLLKERYGGDEGAATTTSRPMAFGLGVRYFIGPTNRVKAFIGALFDIDFTRDVKVDVFLRPIFGLQVEIVRWVAFFVQASVNFSFVRSFGLALDGGGGLQFRFP